MSKRDKSRISVFLKSPLAAFIFLVILTGITIYYTVKQDSNLEPYILRIDSNYENFSCQYNVEEDALPSAEDPAFMPHPNSIYFHETSCRGGLNSRQACSVEAAARAHPKRDVYVMFSAPVKDEIVHRSCLAKLTKFPNIKLARVHLADYAKNTPLEGIITDIPFNKSEWWIEHTSDMLRILTLYKWGGIYLDLDIIVVKSLEPLGFNWVAREDSNGVNHAAIAISMDRLGRRLAGAIIKEIRVDYRPDAWRYNGPEAVTRVLRRMCDNSVAINWSPKTCKGLDVYGPEYFFPVYYTRGGDYFQPGDLIDTDEAYTHHLWNKVTAKKVIQKGSTYEKLAKEFCPSIYEMYGDNFGN